MSFAKLDQTRIVQEALDLLQEQGLAQVSLRKIAARLDVGVSSLYWHIRDKDALYALLSRRILRACLDAVPPCADWASWLRAFGLALWQAQVTIRDVRQLIVVAPVDEETRREYRAEIIGTLEGFGLDTMTATLAQRSVQALVTGWTTLKPLQSGEDEKAYFEAALDALIRGWRVPA